MKHIYLFLFSITLAMGMYAQSVKIISVKTGMQINNTVYDIYGDAARPVIKEVFETVMNTQDSMIVAVKRYELDTVTGTADYFCWYVCYSAKAAGSIPVWAPMDSVTMYDNDTIGSFSVYYEPNEHKGTACYRYVFFPEDNPMDTSFVDVCFKVLTVGIDELNETASLNVYPNPAENIVNINVEKSYNNSELIIRGITGEIIERQFLNVGNNEVDITSLKKGAYLFQLISSDNLPIATEKVIIR